LREIRRQFALAKPIRTDFPAVLMNCYYCEKVARAICRFCGAGVCPDHTKASRFVSGWAAEGRADNVVVFNAIWCGRCAVQPMYVA